MWLQTRPDEGTSQPERVYLQNTPCARGQERKVSVQELWEERSEVGRDPAA